VAAVRLAAVGKYQVPARCFLTGAAAVLPGVVILILYTVLGHLGVYGWGGPVAGFIAGGVVVGYAAAAMVAFDLVHSRFGPQPPIDSTYRVAALAFLVALDASLVAMTPWIVLFVRDP
jgi:hypothetical protein